MIGAFCAPHAFFFLPFILRQASKQRILAMLAQAEADLDDAEDGGGTPAAPPPAATTGVSAVCVCVCVELFHSPPHTSISAFD